PDDDVAFVRAVGTHSRGIGKTTLERIAAYAHRTMVSSYAAAAKVANIESIAKATQGKVAAFVNIIEGLKKNMTGKAAPLMKRVFKETGLADTLRSGGEKEQAAYENVVELINSAAAYDKQAEEPSLIDYLQTIALYSDTDAYDPASGKVSLMTLHAAKGLEFDDVFMIGLEDGLLPHERSMGFGDDIEEERRLFFVGITRARKRLHISHARHRTVHGQFLRTVPSGFLFEIGYEVEESVGADMLDFADSDIHYDDEDSQSDRFGTNELVEHGKFGLGRVKEFLDLGEDSIVVVRFNSGLTKSLMIKYAKLTRPDQ
ncbi:MAG: hypothetical protein DRP66_06925, partial [Planctomycetota bacterium]